MTTLQNVRDVLRRVVLSAQGCGLIVGTVVIALAASAAASPATWPMASSGVEFVLYVSDPMDDPAGQRLTPLDPQTLADRADAAAIELGPVPDGRSVYVFGPGADRVGRWLLLRLDAATLEVLAQRAFDGYRWFMMRPVASST